MGISEKFWSANFGEISGSRGPGRPGNFLGKISPKTGGTRRSARFWDPSKKKPQRGVFFLHRKIHLLKGPRTAGTPNFHRISPEIPT